ncbi:hypothetical protein ACFQH9_02170 [Pseudonocardia lutea]|uniref:Uncharacterized protein n=1 Tax=Pseudonocardia lutea TaxID=2172015 RepID=A0ABW1I2B8_9PSEU
MAEFECVLAARVPQEVGPPNLVEVDRLVFDTLKYTDELNRPGSASAGCPIRSLSDAVKERLSNLRNFPSELWVYADDGLAWAGEIQVASVAGQAVQLSAAGLLGYTFRMGVTADLVFSEDDQFLIGKALVDHWQDLPFGDYGLDTSGIGTSGVLRDRTYLASELHNIGTRLAELGAVENGFDIWVDPDTRELRFAYPTRGLDLSASVFLDERNIDSADVALSVAPDDLVSDGLFSGTTEYDDGESQTLYVARANVAVREAYGRTWGSENFDKVSVLTTLEEHGDAYLAARAQQFFQPGVTVKSRIGCEPGDFGPGDTVSYAYDAGLGLQAGAYRVSKLSVSVDRSNDQTMEVEFV